MKIGYLLRDMVLLILAGMACYKISFAITHKTTLAVVGAVVGSLALFLLIVYLWDEYCASIVLEWRLKIYEFCADLKEVIPF